MSIHRKFTTLCFAAVLAFGLAACGGGDDDMETGDTMEPVVEPQPDPIDVERKAISDAIAAAAAAAGMVNDTSDDASVMAADAAVAAAMAAIDGATLISAGEAGTNRASLATISGQLGAAKASRTMAMTLANERMAISDAISAAMTAVNAVMDDSDDATVTAAEEAVAAATAAIAAAGHISNSEAATARGQVAGLQSDLDDAKSSRQTAMNNAAEQRRLAMEAAARRTTQLTMITNAIAAATTAVGAVNDASSADDVTAAEAAVSKARMAIADAADVSDADKAPHTASVDTLETSLSNARDSWQTAQNASMELANQRAAISTAIGDARTAVNGINDDSTDEEVDAAEKAISDARVAIAGQDAVPDAEKDANNATVAEIENQLGTAKESRTAAMEKADEEQKMADEEAAATAAKLYAGIGAPAGTAGTPAPGDRIAGYNTAETAIEVSWDADATVTPTPVTLSENKDVTVADNHGWEGKMYADPAGGDMYEAVVYSNVGTPTEGDKFGQIGVTTPAAGYEYGLNAAGQHATDTNTTAAYVDLVDSSNFDQSAGVKRFPLPTPNPGQATVVSVSGTFHGVSGTYSCTPGASAVCAANVSGDGFQLGTVPSATDATFTDGGGAWMFKPSNPEARVMESADVNYASYGWWIRKAENDGPFTASAFVDEKGTVAAASGLDDLDGTATYIGGAAGKYALASSTGGTNDAGHFTARAKLEADFTNNTLTTAISGTLDMFMGADDQPRDWEVKLKSSAIADTGGIGNDGNVATSPGGTVWTIGEDAAKAAGQWSGTLRENGTDGVPKVATGTFYSTYGTAGRMVGAFGANKQ